MIVFWSMKLNLREQDFRFNPPLIPRKRVDSTFTIQQCVCCVYQEPAESLEMLNKTLELE